MGNCREQQVGGQEALSTGMCTFRKVAGEDLGCPRSMVGLAQRRQMREKPGAEGWGVDILSMEP